MGRHIYADKIGISIEDPWVHKFWVGVQPSDVSDFLEMREVTTTVAYLEVSQQVEIGATVVELMDEFKRTYGLSYGEYMASDEVNSTEDSKAVRARQLLASRINLGEHLLATIRNMKVRGIDEQELVIDY